MDTYSDIMRCAEIWFGWYDTYSLFFFRAGNSVNIIHKHPLCEYRMISLRESIIKNLSKGQRYEGFAVELYWII